MSTIPLELITHQNIDDLCYVLGLSGNQMGHIIDPDVAVLHDFLLDVYPDTTDLIDPAEIVLADEGSQLSKWLAWAAPDAKINQGVTTQESFWNRHGGAIIYRIRIQNIQRRIDSQPLTVTINPGAGSVPYGILQRSTHGDTLTLRKRCSMVARLCDSGLLPEIL